jgi:tetratricopeptide (TPR) repeat protein
VNYNLIAGLPLDKVVVALESIPATKESAVLQEKLAELYFRQGKPSSSVSSLQNALKFDPTPQQRVRLMLALAGQLQPLSRDADAYAVYQDFLTQCTDYPDKVAIYKDLRDLAQKLGKHDDEQKYQRDIDQIAPPHALNQKMRAS